MPNVFAHIGIGGIATRIVIPDAPARWIYAGCVIPDLPWIVQRLVWTLDTGIDRYDLRVYAIGQASLAGCLILCCALATVSRFPAKVLAILAFNSLIHLLLDACQTKWGSGVHLVAPLSWESMNLGLFWPESAVTWLLTGLGVGFFVVDLTRNGNPACQPATRSICRWMLSAGLVSIYILMPLLLANGVNASNTHFVQTLRERDSRSGHPIELDRAKLAGHTGAFFVITFAGERIGVTGNVPRDNGVISLQGRFLTDRDIKSEKLHLHVPTVRDAASTVGLIAVGCYWFVCVWRRRSREFEMQETS